MLGRVPPPVHLSTACLLCFLQGGPFLLEQGGGLCSAQRGRVGYVGRSLLGGRGPVPGGHPEAGGRVGLPAGCRDRSQDRTVSLKSY